MPSQNKEKNHSASHFYNAPTQPYPIIKPHLTLPSRIPTRPLIPQVVTTKHSGYLLSNTAFQICYAIIAVFGSALAFYYLANFRIYQIVALIVIVILWSHIASKAAERKPIDMLETRELPTLKVLQQNQENISYTDNTNVFLQAVKTSFLEYTNETH